MTLTFGSLFSGIGGFDLGLERAGLECQWQVENDPYCIRVLTKHWPDIPRYGDVRELSGSALETVDVICGGFPCQPVSTAGRRQAQADPRWLWPHFARLVDELSPRYVIVENVPGLWTTTGGAEVVSDLATLGYDIRWDRLFATTVGAPHLRERVFIMAHSLSNRLERVLTDRPASGTTFRSNIDVAYPRGRSRHWQQDPAEKPESGMGRVAHGVPSRVDRLRVLGNAVVPQVAEVIGNWLIEIDEQSHEDS